MDTSETGDTTAALPVAVGYIRRSHESTERTVSLAAQRAAVERYATDQGWHCAKSMTENRLYVIYALWLPIKAKAVNLE